MTRSQPAKSKSAEDTVPRWELEEARRERAGMQQLAQKNKGERDYYREWAERFAGTLDAMVERPADRALQDEAAGYLTRWYRERLEGFRG